MMAMSWKRRRRKERPLVIIADISGSMEKYADIFLVFAHAAQRRLREVEIFTFSTRPQPHHRGHAAPGHQGRAGPGRRSRD